MKSKFLIISGAVALALATFFSVAHANPSYFQVPVQTATATTTVTYMTTGAATTTLTFDSYYINSLGTNTKTDSITLFTQFLASSTASVLGINFEYSQDGVDWYSNNLSFGNTATTSSVIYLQPPSSLSWTFASSTTNGVLQATTTPEKKAVTVQLPTRFVRAIYTLTGTPGAIWAQFIPSRERAETR